MSFHPAADRLSLTEAAKRHLANADVVHVFEMMHGDYPWKLVARKLPKAVSVVHFHEDQILEACRTAAKELGIEIA